MKYCPLNTILNKDQVCKVCQNNNKYYLKDRNNKFYRLENNNVNNDKNYYQDDPTDMYII